MLIAKTFFCCIALIGIIYGIYEFYRGHIRLFRFSIWIILSILFCFIVLFIEKTTNIANLFGVGRGVDFVFYLCFILVFFLILKLYQKIDELNSDLTKVVRYIALDEVKKKNTNTKL